MKPHLLTTLRRVLTWGIFLCLFQYALITFYLQFDTPFDADDYRQEVMQVDAARFQSNTPQKAHNTPVVNSQTELMPTPAVDRCIHAELTRLKADLAIRREIVKLAHAGVSSADLERMAMSVGIPINQVRRALLGQHSSNLLEAKSRMLVEGERDQQQLFAHMQKEQETARIQGVNVPNMLQQSLDNIALVDLLKQGEPSALAAYLEKNTPSDTATQYQPLFSTDLMSAILILHPQLSVNQLQAYIDAGVVPTFAALTRLYHRENRLALAETLLHAPVDYQAFWEDHYVTNNLLLDALAHGDFLLARFWFDRHVVAQPNVNDMNALDHFPQPAQDEKALAYALLFDITQVVDRPYDLNNMPRLVALQAEAKAYGHDISLNFPSFQVASELLPYEQQLQHVYADSAYQLPLTRDAFLQCADLNEFQAFRRAYQDDPTLTAEQIILQASERGLLDTEWLAFVLGSKAAKEHLSHRYGDMDAHHIEQHQQLLTALAQGASYQDIKQLVAKMDGIHESVVFQVAFYARGDVLALLVQAGLDVHAVDAQGQNALFYAIRSHSPDAVKMFTYLHQNYQVALTNQHALLNAMINASFYDGRLLGLLEWLLNQGVQVTDTQRALFYKNVSTFHPKYEFFKRLLSA